MNLKFSGRGLAFLSNYMAKNDIRYYLNGIYLQPLSCGGALGVASNGHIAGLWYDKDGEASRSVIVSVTPPLIRACAGKGLYGVPPALELRDGRLACVAADGELYIQPNGRCVRIEDGVEPWEVHGKFPDVGRLLPSPEEFAMGPVDSFNSSFIGVVAKSFKGNAIAMRQAEASKTAVFVASSMPEAVALVMPIRDQKAALPAWIDSIR